MPFAAVNCTIFLPRLRSSLHSSTRRSWLKHDCKIRGGQRWLQDLGRTKFGSRVEFDFYIVGERDQVAKAFIWLSAVVGRPGEERATLPQPSCHPDLQLRIQGVFRTLTVSCKTDPRNSPGQDEIWISWFAIIFSGFHFFFPLHFFLTVNFRTFWHAGRGQFWLGLAQGKTAAVKTPLVFLFPSEPASVSGIWFSFLVEAGPGRLSICVVS